MIALFVTGTDTGVGKTTVSCALLRAAAARGLRTVGLKPAESGCTLSGGTLQPSDALALQAASTIQLDLDTVCPYRFEEPVAPGVAATRTGTRIRFERIAECLAAARAHEPDLLLVEGAGGILVPLGEGATIQDLAYTLALPVLIVGRHNLGTINHTTMTVEVARAHGLTVHGVILNHATPDPITPANLASNLAEIETGASTRVFGTLRHNPSPPDTEADLDLDALLR